MLGAVSNASAGSVSYLGYYGDASHSHVWADEDPHEPNYYTVGTTTITPIEKFDRSLGYLRSMRMEAEFEYDFSVYLDAAGIDVTTPGTYTHASATLTSLMAEIVLSPGNGFGYVGTSVSSGEITLSVTGNVGDGTDYSDAWSDSGIRSGFSYNLLEFFPKVREFVTYVGAEPEYLALTADVAVPVSADLHLINLLSAEVGMSASMVGGTVSVVYEYSEPGDANGDDLVSFDDLLVLAQNYGSQGDFTKGDFTQDGIINFDDLLILAQTYSGSPGLVDGASTSEAFQADWTRALSMVPEPTSAAALSIAMGLIRRRRS